MKPMLVCFYKYYYDYKFYANYDLRKMTKYDNDFSTTWYREKKEINDEQMKWLNAIEENCLKDIPFPCSGNEPPLARLQTQNKVLRMKTPQLLSLENILIRPKPNSSNIFVDIDGKNYGTYTIELQSAADAISPDFKINYCNAEGCSSNKSNLEEKFDKTKLYSGKVITASIGITHKNTKNNAFFFIDQSINNRSINYILGMFQINDNEIISLEPYKHRPQFTLEKGTNGNHILYSSKIMPTELDVYRGATGRSKAKPTKFDTNRPVAPTKLVIHNSMLKSAIDQSYLVSYCIFFIFTNI